MKIPTFDLAGKVALVTGGTKGIGFGMAMALSHYGADVAIVGRNKEDGAAAERAASKGGINQLTKVWACELAPYQITVNAIGPAYIKTPMTEDWLAEPERYRNIVSSTLLKRIGELEDLAGPVVFLASDAASYITGQVLYVDGGWLAR